MTKTIHDVLVAELREHAKKDLDDGISRWIDGAALLMTQSADEIERVLAREKAHMSFNDQQRKEIERLTAALSTALKQGEAEGVRKAAEVAYDWGVRNPAPDHVSSGMKIAATIRALLPDEEKPGSGEASDA